MSEHPDNTAHEGRVAFGLGVDLRRFAGVTAFTRGSGGGAVDVVLPSWAAGQGVFDDVVQFACANGTLTTLASQYDAAWDALALVGDLTLVMLPGSGVLEFRGGESYKLKAGAVNVAYGFAAAETDAVNDGGVWKVTATTRPKWGNIDGAPAIETGSGDIDLGAMRHHSIFAALTFALGSIHLEALDNAAIDTAAGGGTPDRGVRWFVATDGQHGRLGWAAPTGTVDEITEWGSRALRQLLGWTGNETVTTADGLDVQLGERPCLLFWHPSRHVERNDLIIDLPGDALRLEDGSIASQTHGAFELDEWSTYLDGPADSVDDYDRVAVYFMRYAARGTRISIWQAWPEHRAYQNTIEVDVDTDAFTTEVTSAGRYEGRVDARIAAKVGDETRMAYSGSMRRAMPVRLFTQRRTAS